MEVTMRSGASSVHDKQHRTPYQSHEGSTRRCLPEERRGTDSSSESNQDDLSVHWQKCYNTLAQYDSKVISMWTDEMNTILFFVSTLFLTTSRSVSIFIF